MLRALIVALCVICGWMNVHAQVTQPLVAVHDSELTRALENMAAVPPTPTNTGKQWWTPDWHYFVMPESVKEALRSDGTAFTVVGDSNIASGLLLTNGQPKYPIVISLASEAIRDDEIAQFTNYVAAGGYLFVGSSSFSRNTNGTTRGDFAFANQLGLHLVSSSLVNWTINNNVTKVLDHRLDSHFPTGQLSWLMPYYSEDIPWGTSPDHIYTHPHDIWRVASADATVLIQGDSYPFLTVKAYGKGYFIYCAAFQPFMGHTGFSPSMYAYVILRRAIEWAFESLNAPVPKLSPWPYQYDAALIIRHDLENFTNEIAAIEASAQLEFTNGARGDYYFCTGTLRDDASPAYDTNAMVAGLRRAVTNYGATIGPHNGGLKNPGNTNLVRGQYDYWHWGTDEVLDLTPAGYANGKAYATASISNSFRDIESWLTGITNGLRSWCQCYFNGTREDSYDLQSQLGVKIAGEQKISPFPHWTLSTLTPNKRYSYLTEPVSDWFVNGLVAQSLEPWHPPGVQTNTTLHAAVDYYYNLGASINFYSHTLSTGLGDAGSLATDYVLYSMNTNLHPRLWPANGVLVYQWWLQRSNVQVTASYSTNGNQTLVNLSISGSSNTNTAVEVLVPGTNSPPCTIQVVTNGVLAGTNIYRVVNGQILRLRVGTTVTNATIGYYQTSPYAPVFSENFDGASPPALPAGWSTTSSGAQTNWVTQAGTNNSPPNAVFSPDATNAGVNELVSPSIVMGVGSGLLSFMHYYDLEPGPTGDAYDGGVLEIKIGTNAFTDIIAAGGAFLSGGYVTNINVNFGNPLAGRQAWSGNSGGFIRTMVSLPPSSAGTNVQFKWRCASDNNNGRTGWWIDSVSVSNRVCLCCLPPNNPPTLPVQANRIVPQQTLLTVTNTGTDPDGNSLFYQLSNAPAGATISGAGVISWTPSAGQAPGVYTLTTIVTDNGFPPLSTNNSFVVTVKGVPIFNGTPPNRTIAPLATFTVTNAATDPNTPPNSLTYSLLSPPAGASVASATGVITWNPAVGQDHTTNVIRTVVSNDLYPTLSATNTFTLIVNSDPVLALTAATLVQENCLSTNNVIDPGETVTVLFSLKNNGLSNTTNLVATLLATNGVVSPGAQSYGVLVAGGSAVSQAFTFGNTGACGGSITAVLQLQDGTRNYGLFSNTFPLGVLSAIFNQNFDGVTAPGLPAGWTTTSSGAQSPWFTTNTVADTAPNAAFSTDANNMGVNELVSPPITLPSGPAQLSFRHSYSFESDLALVTNAFDGGVLEYRIGTDPTNAFLDITNGGSWAANGYNRRVDSRYGNPLTNRWVWSGTNGGYVTTTVNLPAAAAGQTIQLRWRAGTDNSNGGGGWRIDTVSITGTVCCARAAPFLPVQADRTNFGVASLTVTNTATDATVPPGSLVYALTAAPVGAQIDANGIITWTPVPAQVPGTNVFTTTVTDGGIPPLSATNSFTVYVLAVHNGPSLAAQTNRIVDELRTLVVTNAATDNDIPPLAVSYQLLNPPDGAVIDTNGVITWTPSEAQGPGTNTITTVATDTGQPQLSATNSFIVVVNEINTAPVLPTQTNRTIVGTATLVVTNTATDSDLPANSLAYSLLVAPSNAVIDANGVITWTPTVAQVPSTNVISTVVTDFNPAAVNAQHLSATNTFTVFVQAIHNGPSLPAQNDQTINELTTLTVTNTATDSDIPALQLFYQLLNPPAGAAIDTNGVITWTPAETQGPGTNTITTVVTDSGQPQLSATNSFRATVNEVNTAPVLLDQTNQTVIGTATLVVTNTATDSDIPANTLTYTLLVAPTNAVIDTNGVITWTPTVAQVPGTNVVTTVVTDFNPAAINAQHLSATNTFMVFVQTVHNGPTLATQSDRNVNELVTLTVTNTGSDADIPALQLTYQLLNPPTGAVIDTNGVITWTPTEAQGPGTYTLTTVVTDNGQPQLSATNSFNVVVNEVNQPPVLPFQPDRKMVTSTVLIVTNTATDPDIPPNHIFYNLLSAPSGAAIDTNGIITWTAPASSNLVADDFITVATDDGIPALSATNQFTVTVIPPASLPAILSVELAGDVATVTWNSVPGYTYQLEYKDQLLAMNWTPILPTVTASGSTASATNAVNGTLRRFYRVSLLQ